MNGLLTESLALFVSMVFAAAGLTKVAAWQALPAVVQNFRILPGWLVLPASILLPPLEILIATGILLARTRMWAAALAAILFAVFGAALAINLYRGQRQIDCGCFRSDLRQPISAAVVLRNLMLVLCALVVLTGSGAATLSPFAWALASGGAITLFLCYASLGLLFQAAPPSYEDNFHAYQSSAS